ncbi:hypothetical protein N431DRAFT_487719 [Stipitochalara longipes BDJ]|nr:hypothetical protein N431DRAFT_487719 [Stipitochalara longipes BDJ]
MTTPTTARDPDSDKANEAISCTEGRATSDLKHQNVSLRVALAGIYPAPTSGGTSAPAVVVQKTGAGWVGSGGEMTLWHMWLAPKHRRLTSLLDGALSSSAPNVPRLISRPATSRHLTAVQQHHSAAQQRFISPSQQPELHMDLKAGSRLLKDDSMAAAGLQQAGHQDSLGETVSESRRLPGGSEKLLPRHTEEHIERCESESSFASSTPKVAFHP